MWFVSVTASSTFLLVFALLRQGCGHDIATNHQKTDVSTSTYGSSFVSYIRPPRAAVSFIKSSCLAPRQPDNGEWRLHQYFCAEGSSDCKVPEGTELGLGYQLIYSCAAGYEIEGNNIVSCTAKGDWYLIPSCREIRCPALNTVSRTGQCVRSRKIVDCDLPVLPQTSAEVTCRPGYRKDTTVWTQRKNILNCNEGGEWEPQPIRCIPACGRVATSTQPLSIDGWDANIVDFPWHATLYKKKSLSKESRKEFICGGTIIQANIVMTAAHCVYDETIEKTEDLRKLFVITGNTFRDYDHPMHEPYLVTKAAVQQVFTHFSYYGLRGNYASDIALLKLQKPFVFSEILLPACLDTSSSHAPHLESGSFGKLAGFGVTATGESSPILQTLTVPYISYADCKVSKNAVKNYVFLTNDKFCAGYTNGSAVCEGDSGGGLVFEKNDKWYVMGIVSLGLGVDTNNGARTCERYAYTLYTRVSDYADWILGVILDIEQQTPRPTSSPTLRPSTMTVPTSTSAPLREDETSIVLPAVSTRTSNCAAPPQPLNGQWKLRPMDCSLLGYAKVDCKVPPGVEIDAGSSLVYSCDAGHKLRGSTEVYCARGGKWSSSPACVEIKCSSLNSASLIANCISQSGSWISCDSGVPPKTVAKLQCRTGYMRESTTFAMLQRQNVECKADGKWEPDPIQCTPVCGHEIIPQQQPTDVKGIVGEFPWHASIYTNAGWEGQAKELRCGATIIKANILLTAAHCVYNEETQATDDPGKFFVIMGHLFRIYESPSHDSRYVEKRTVKSIHIPCDYQGLSGNYASDIALLELNDPLRLWSIVSPACLENSEDVTLTLDKGAYGKISAFGETATKLLSDTLQTITVPFVPDDECKMSAVDNSSSFDYDKFCTGYTNGSAICETDSGGGLVFKKNGSWYLLGVASKPLNNTINNGERRCYSRSYFLYTWVSAHISWIQNVMFQLERNKSYQPCN